MGEIIDKHDAVIRFNTFVSSGVWQNYTGVKSTLRVFNKKRAETMKSTKNVYISSTKTKDKKDVENELWIFWNYMSFPFLPPVLRANKNSLNSKHGGVGESVAHHLRLLPGQLPCIASAARDERLYQ